LDYFVLTTDTLKQQAEAMIQNDIREAHFKYAFMITEMYHNTITAQSAKSRYLNVAGGGIPESVAEYAVDGSEISLVELLRRVGFAVSGGEARRSIRGRGVKIDGETVTDTVMNIKIGNPFILQFGKNKFVKIRKNL